MEMAVILEFWERVLESTVFVKTVISGDGETAGCWVPKHDPIGVITATQGDAGTGLGAEIAARGTGAVDCLSVVTD